MNGILANKVVEEVADKAIAKPADAPTVGKVLKVKSVNEDGTFVCEWADETGGGGAVEDVQINGTSIIADGVAQIPYATQGEEIRGVVAVYNASQGLEIVNGMITLKLTNSRNGINIRRTKGSANDFQAITTATFDYAVKVAMCDGKGTAWTEAEQLVAQQRLGILSVEEVLFG